MAATGTSAVSAEIKPAYGGGNQRRMKKMRRKGRKQK